jgi:hypothetical protein
MSGYLQSAALILLGAFWLAFWLAFCLVAFIAHRVNR